MCVFKVLVFALILVINNVVFTFCQSNLLSSRKFCGYQRTDDYIRDNDKITIDEFPWLAQLLYNKNRRVECTGSLINNRYVLTAAHCIKSDYSQLVGVRLGDYNITTDKDCVNLSFFGEECSEPVEEYDIEEKIPHPRHQFGLILNDIGLIRLSRNVSYSDYIRPICLPTNNFNLKIGDKYTISGWGFVNIDGKPTEVKKKILTKLISLDECRDIYKEKHLFISDETACALDEENRTCQGDSGGPLMVSVKNQWEQVGVLSFGDCARNFPSGYMRISSYLDWITQNLRK